MRNNEELKFWKDVIIHAAPFIITDIPYVALLIFFLINR